jgi:hypothetical protein
MPGGRRNAIGDRTEALAAGARRLLDNLLRLGERERVARRVARYYAGRARWMDPAELESFALYGTWDGALAWIEGGCPGGTGKALAYMYRTAARACTRRIAHHRNVLGPRRVRLSYRVPGDLEHRAAFVAPRE